MANLKLVGFGLSMLVLGSILAYALVELKNSMTIAESGSWNEPPTLRKEIVTVDDVLDDLNYLACTIINCTSIVNQGNSIFASSYGQFRRVAYNSKIVFYDAELNAYDSTFSTEYNAIMIVYRPFRD